MSTAAQLLLENGERVVIKIDQDRYRLLFQRITKGRAELRPIRFEEASKNKEICGKCGDETHQDIIIYLKQLPAFSNEDVLHFIAAIDLVLAHEISHAILFSGSVSPLRSLLHNICQKLLGWHYKTCAYFIPKTPSLALWIYVLSTWCAQQIRGIRELVTESLTRQLLKSYLKDFARLVVIENR